MFTMVPHRAYGNIKRIPQMVVNHAARQKQKYTSVSNNTTPTINATD